jgi:hypothetical protein
MALTPERFDGLYVAGKRLKEPSNIPLDKSRHGFFDVGEIGFKVPIIPLWRAEPPMIALPCEGEANVY